ncbi:unnamed protein product [Rotaria sp. Silwood1]|nr:unnamed protein product [Rotaria sp. Silwood1]CAF3505529.1 unnamed protein product [Rotaria sp. Silwood1]CAF3533881.1 unnamed protein product [Rotaria sp. Silwood1]
MTSTEELIELVKKLKRERSFVSAEQKRIREQYAQLLKLVEHVQHREWITSHQRYILSSLIYPNRNDQNIQPKSCFQYIQVLDNIPFIDSYKYFNYLQDLPYLRLLTYLRQQPNLLALCLASIEKTDALLTNAIIPILMSALYNQCLYYDDELFTLELLRSLIDIQLKNESNPRIILQRSSCSFKIVFDAFLTASQSCKLFLTAALHEPIMQLLIDDECFYDINPDISLNRLSKQERHKTFGTPNTRDYLDKIQKYRNVILTKLYTFTYTFIESLRNALEFFPTSLSFLMSQMFIILSQSSELSSREIRCLCCDIIMTLFIGPAICEPEKHGIIADIPISRIARHNLNQIAIILQTLAMSNDIESKTKDLYNKFKENCVSSILDNIIDSSRNVIFPLRSSTLSSSNITRSVILITQKQLRQLILFCRRAVNEINDNELKQQLDTYLRALIPLEECLKSPPIPSLPSTPPVNEQQTEHNHRHHHRKTNGTRDTTAQKLERSENIQFPEEVIVFTLESSDSECPGMLSEEKVLQENERTKLIKTSSANEFDQSATEKRLRFRLNDTCSVGNISDNLEGLEGISEGAASTGNLSVTSSCDDLDKATNEIETDPLFDNGSVSGRATPNLSGRDTPSSHISLDSSDRRTTSTNNAHIHSQDSIINSQTVTTINANHNPLMGSVQRGPALPIVVQKPFREDVPDKFNLFDLPQQRPTLEAGDETRSTISDNWSTMNAGISEIDGQEQAAARLNEIVEELPIVEPRGHNHILLPESNSITLNKPIDQQSDCWSTEAFASDSETYSEDGSNILRLANNQNTTSTSNINELLVPSFSIDNNNSASSSMEELSKQQKRSTNSGTISSKLADPVDILLMKSSLESLPSISDSGILLDSGKFSQQAPSPLKSPTETRSVHFPLIDLSNSSNEQSTILSSSQNLPSSNIATSNSIIKPSSTNKSNEKRSTNAISALRRRFVGSSASSSSHRRDRSIPEDDHSHIEQQPTETISADDILARYSSKGSTSIDHGSKINTTADESHTETITIETFTDTIPYYDPTNLDTCRAFIDAKKKLRIVLATADTDSINYLNSPINFNQYLPQQQQRQQNGSSSIHSLNRKSSNNLILFLRSQLYEAIALQDRDLQAQLYETLRCVQQFNENECKVLIRSMIDDYRSRSVYITYLVKNNENLLNITYHQDRLLVRIQRDQDLCKQHLINYLIKLFLDCKEHLLQKLIDKFSHLSIAEEKMHLIELFLQDCCREITSDINWKTASPEQFAMSQTSIERIVMAKFYTAALYPNGQIDVQRDQIFSGHIRTLAEQLDPNHQKLRIQKLYQRECPWPSAQAELRLINAYKTPRDKVACVQRCIRIIQNLIRLASNSAAGADDTIPILIYVIVKANPPNLLSIMQYVQDLYSSRFTDEESYYWTMFVSGVKFIHEMI